MATLKKDIDPIGAKVLVKTQIRGTITWHEYKVHTVTGADENVPNPDGPIIHMELNEKNGISLQQYISLPLSAFPGLCRPSGAAFWESVKFVAA
jgi:hypothetical protein